MAALALTRLDRMLSASKALPQDMASLFDDMFVRCKSEEQICDERKISQQELKEMLDNVMRNLRAASS